MEDSNTNNLHRDDVPEENQISNNLNGSANTPAVEDQGTSDVPAQEPNNQAVAQQNIRNQQLHRIPYHEPRRVRHPPMTIRTELIPVGVHRYRLVYLDELPNGEENQNEGNGEGPANPSNNNNNNPGVSPDDESSSEETGSTGSSSSTSTLAPDDVVNGQLDPDQHNNHEVPPPNEPNPQPKDNNK